MMDQTVAVMNPPVVDSVESPGVAWSVASIEERFVEIVYADPGFVDDAFFAMVDTLLESTMAPIPQMRTQRTAASSAAGEPMTAVASRLLFSRGRCAKEPPSWVRAWARSPPEA